MWDKKMDLKMEMILCLLSKYRTIRSWPLMYDVDIYDPYCFRLLVMEETFANASSLRTNSISRRGEMLWSLLLSILGKYFRELMVFYFNLFSFMFSKLF